MNVNYEPGFMNESQRSMVAGRIANLGHGGPRASDQGANWPLGEMPTAPMAITNAEAAEMLNVGERSVKRARRGSVRARNGLSHRIGSQHD